MRIGIDLDNTLVCYDQLFWMLAWERGAIDETVPRQKEAVRDELRRRGREPVWTELQGEAYGPRMLEAMPFPGVQPAIDEFRRRGWEVLVISHKTRVPFAGPQYDLHAAARNWLATQQVLSSGNDSIYLELTKEDKLRRIAEMRCDWFIDDLPELLTEPAFPGHVRRMVFDPHRLIEPLAGIVRLHDWAEAAELIARESRS